jgi:autophagy-related protein 2
MNGSIRTFAPNHTGALVFYVDDLDFSTDIVGDCPDSSFHLFAPTLAVLLIDDIFDHIAEADAQSFSDGASYWKVRPTVG